VRALRTIRQSGNTPLEEAADLRKLAKAIDRFEERAAGIVQRAVERERGYHAYTNRTGDAERSTRFNEASGGGWGAEMGVEYASYLQNGWSRLDQLMERADELIRREADSIDFGDGD
jgi:hypothetical protein